MRADRSLSGRLSNSARNATGLSGRVQELVGGAQQLFGGVWFRELGAERI
jgi:hypothetical protein